MIAYREYPAPAGLRNVIECLWRASDSSVHRTRTAEHIVPDGCPELIVHLGDRFSRRVNERWRRQPVAFLAGTLTRPWQVRAGARVHTLGVRFRPAAVTQIFDIDMSAATDREVPLAELIGRPRANALLASLRESNRGAAVIACTRRWLAEQHVVSDPPADLARRAVHAVLADRGRMRVADLAGQLGVSKRRLERSFARHLGIRPKLFARIVRLQAALATLHTAARDRAVQWALEAGYFDQAHLARDFRSIAERLATRPRERDGELARHFTDPARLLALLHGE